MKYDKIYEQLIKRAQLRETPNEYCELHHIVPRCFYGSNDDRNLVVLTLREHFIAHRLLAKMRPWHKGMLQAVACFMWGDRINSRQFEIARKANANANIGENNPMYGKISPRRGKKNTAEHNAKVSAALKGKLVGELNPRYGKKHTEESKALMSRVRKGTLCGEKNGMYGKRGKDSPLYGRKHTEESIAKMIASQQANPHKHTAEAKAAIAAFNKGKKRSLESIAKQKATLLRNKAKVVVCD